MDKASMDEGIYTKTIIHSLALNEAKAPWQHQTLKKKKKPYGGRNYL